MGGGVRGDGGLLNDMCALSASGTYCARAKTHTFEDTTSEQSDTVKRLNT